MKTTKPPSKKPRAASADTFTLSITLGNAAMQSPADVATALHRIARVLETSEGTTVAGGSVIDTNGNKVGTWFGSFPSDPSTTDGDA